MKQFDIGTVIIMGLFFVILTMGVFALCIYTLKKVRTIYKYCEERFDKIETLLNTSSRNTNELTNLLSELNGNLANKNNGNIN